MKTAFQKKVILDQMNNCLGENNGRTGKKSKGFKKQS